MDESPGPSERSTFAGPTSELVELLRPHFQKLRGFVYGEEKTKKGDKEIVSVDSKTIIGKRDLVASAEQLAKNLSFKESQTYEAMMLVAKERNEKWQVSEARLEEWAQEMTSRFRLMMRHVQQYRVRAKPPQWVAHLELPAWPRVVSGEIPEVTAKAAVEKPSMVGTEAATYATWDPDLNKVQRAKPGSRKKWKTP